MFGKKVIELLAISLKGGMLPNFAIIRTLACSFYTLIPRRYEELRSEKANPSSVSELDHFESQ